MRYKKARYSTLVHDFTIVKDMMTTIIEVPILSDTVVPEPLPNVVVPAPIDGNVRFANWTIRESDITGKVLIGNVRSEHHPTKKNTYLITITPAQKAILPLGKLWLSLDYGIPDITNIEIGQCQITVINPVIT